MPPDDSRPLPRGRSARRFPPLDLETVPRPLSLSTDDRSTRRDADHPAAEGRIYGIAPVRVHADVALGHHAARDRVAIKRRADSNAPSAPTTPASASRCVKGRPAGADDGRVARTIFNSSGVAQWATVRVLVDRAQQVRCSARRESSCVGSSSSISGRRPPACRRLPLRWWTRAGCLRMRVDVLRLTDWRRSPHDRHDPLGRCRPSRRRRSRHIGPHPLVPPPDLVEGPSKWRSVPGLSIVVSPPRPRAR